MSGKPPNTIFPRAGVLRPSQIITTFGPGSIYDLSNDSVMIMGIDYWDSRYLTEIDDRRLLAHIRKIKKFRNVHQFRLPSSGGNYSNVAVTTFPRVGECPVCHLLTKREGHPTNKSLNCPNCKNADGSHVTTHPARLVMACLNGHIDDFPWFSWVGRHKNKDCDDTKLYLREGKESAGLEGLEVYCDNCEATRDLGGALSDDSLEGIARCQGKRPWLRHQEECSQQPRGLLKGASNVYFSSTLSALLIPPFAHPLDRMLRPHWPTIEKLRQEPQLLESIIDVILKSDAELTKRYTKDRILDHVKQSFAATTEDEIEEDIKDDEWEVLNWTEPQDYDDFSTELATLPHNHREVMDKLVVVKRLKETIVLKGFCRIDPFDPEDPNPTKIAPISVEDPTWLPAVENRGEGIFLSFHEKKILEWENLPLVRQRTGLIYKQYVSRMRDRGFQVKSVPPARVILLHTLSHLLIRELSHYAGYSAASIKERVYAKTGMAGILLYTASSSADGSLGGLVKLGKTYFSIILDNAIEKSKWCSGDPYCAIHDPESTGRENGAACHACLFLPETSCTRMNSLLDREAIGSTIKNSTGKGMTAGFFLNDKA